MPGSQERPPGGIYGAPAERLRRAVGGGGVPAGDGAAAPAAPAAGTARGGRLGGGFLHAVRRGGGVESRPGPRDRGRERDQRRRRANRQGHRHRDHRREGHLRFPVPGPPRHRRVTGRLPAVLPQWLCLHQRGIPSLLVELCKGSSFGADGPQSRRGHRCVSCWHSHADIWDGPLRSVHQQYFHRCAFRSGSCPQGIIIVRDVRFEGTAKVDEDRIPRRAQDKSWACHCDDSAGEDVREEQDGKDSHGAGPPQLLDVHLLVVGFSLHPAQSPQGRA